MEETKVFMVGVHELISQMEQSVPTMTLLSYDDMIYVKSLNQFLNEVIRLVTALERDGVLGCSAVVLSLKNYVKKYAVFTVNVEEGWGVNTINNLLSLFILLKNDLKLILDEFVGDEGNVVFTVRDEDANLVEVDSQIDELYLLCMFGVGSLVEQKDNYVDSRTKLTENVDMLFDMLSRKTNSPTISQLQPMCAKLVGEHDNFLYNSTISNFEEISREFLDLLDSTTGTFRSHGDQKIRGKRRKSNRETDSRRQKYQAVRGFSIASAPQTINLPLHSEVEEVGTASDECLKHADLMIDFFVNYFTTIKEEWRNMEAHEKTTLKNTILGHLNNFQHDCLLIKERPRDKMFSHSSSKVKLKKRKKNSETKRRKEDQDVDPTLQSPFQHCSSIFRGLATSLLENLSTVIHSQSTNDTVEEIYSSVEELYLFYMSIYQSVIEQEESDTFLHFCLTGNIEDCMARSKRGNLQEIHKSCRANKYHLKLLKNYLLERIVENSNAIFRLSDIALLSFNTLEYSEESVLYFVSLFTETINLIEDTMNAIETLHQTDSMEIHTESIIPNTALIHERIWNETKIDQKLTTPENLVVRLTSHQQTASLFFVYSFLYTYNEFISTIEFITMLTMRFNVPGNYDKQTEKTIQMKVLDIFDKWIKLYYYEIDENIHNILTEFFQSINQPYAKNKSDSLLLEINNKGAHFQKDFKFEVLPFGQVSKSLDISNVDPIIIAEQMTIIDFEEYSKIQSSELIHQKWSRPEYLYHSQNVSKLLQRANKISFWIATRILLQKTLKERAKVISTFIAIAKKLRLLNNFNSLMGIIAGLNIGPISRLRFSFSKVSKTLRDDLDELQELMVPSGSFKALREAINGDNVQEIVPYLGLHLSDLTFIDEGNSNFIGEKVNFEKFEMMYESIDNLTMHQVTSVYKLDVDESLKVHLQELPALSNDELYDLSYLREPKGSTIKDCI